MCRVTCAHCHDSFLFNTLNNALARYYLPGLVIVCLKDLFENALREFYCAENTKLESYPQMPSL